jgi:pSer/pThr/pTyr-binding forkhead associated (FHA) protein
MHVLVIQSGKHKGKKVKLADPEIIIGRDEEAKIRIASTEVSRQHCQLIPREDGVLVRDLGSRNGTFVDGVPIQGEVLLQPGGSLAVGPLVFELLGGESAKKTAATKTGLKKNGDPKLSDDDIASWLTEEGQLLTSDTTIVKSKDAEKMRASTPPAGDAPAAAPPPAPIKKKKEFKTVADEAADIIRRHRESLEDGPKA